MSVSLTLDQVKERARRAPMVPIFRDMLSDALTPVTAFAALGKEGPAFLLESVEGGEHLGRYSFVAADPMAIISITGGHAMVRDADGERALTGADPWKAIESYLGAFLAEPGEGLPEGFCGGAVGYLGYEAARYLEHLPVPEADPLRVPDGVLIVTDTLACFDHVRHRLKLVTHVRAQQEPIELNLVKVDRKLLHIKRESMEYFAEDIEILTQKGVVVLLERFGRALGLLGEMGEGLDSPIDESSLAFAEDLLVDHCSSSLSSLLRIRLAISITRWPNSGSVFVASVLGRPNGTTISFLSWLGRAVET